MKQMSPQMNRFAAVGLLVLLVLAVIFYGIVPLVQGYSDRADEAAMLSKRLTVLRSLLANEPVIDEELQRLKSLNTNGDIFLKGNKAAIASANLREFISDAVKESGGVLVSTQEYEIRSVDTASAVGLRLQFTGEMDRLLSLLYKLENARPLIFIDKITVTSSAARRRVRSRTRRGGTTRASKSRMSLTVRMDVFGYMVTGEA